MTDFTQGLYYKNFPATKPPHKVIPRFKQLFEESFLRSETKPFFLFTGTNNIVELENLFLNSKQIKRLDQQGLDFYIYEPLSSYRTKPHNREFYSEFIDLKPQLYADELDSIQKFKNKYGIRNINVYTCDYKVKEFFQKQYPDLNLYCLDIFLRDYFPGSKINDNVKPTKKFVCTNWRYTKHRHIIMCNLHSKPGHYSWQFKADKKLLQENTFLTKDFWMSIHNKTTMNGLAELNLKSPMAIDLAPTSSKYVEPHLGTKWPDDQHKLEANLKDAYYDSFISIVNETRFAQPTANLSEKVFTAMWFQRPFLIVGPPYSLEYLKKLGFSTWDRWIDESYDTIEDHTKRMMKILDIIEKINDTDQGELCIMLDEMSKYLKRNQKLITRFYNDVTVLE
tara:strand:+ start:87 stop:1268 length:1182 start_codon:yes stop_codon:yes gene_type:complete